MKSFCKCRLKEYLAECLAYTRKSQKLTQEEFSEMLMIDTRSYASLEHAESLCCTLTFIMFICYFCNDVDKLVYDLRSLIEDAYSEDLT